MHAGAVGALVQQLADFAADAEGEPHRAVPRLANDVALADQFAVIAHDLMAARPSAELTGRACAALRKASKQLT